ncbi:MAG TPA: hypothetical protein VHN99_02205, partial [Deinococcales bacterium]|nr:hypothetical protein [Deinococcales bacterium]
EDLGLNAGTTVAALLAEAERLSRAARFARPEPTRPPTVPPAPAPARGTVRRGIDFSGLGVLDTFFSDRLAHHAEARARYEVASGLYKIYAAGYKRTVVNVLSDLDTPEERQRFRDIYDGTVEWASAIYRAAKARDLACKFLAARPEGIHRKELQRLVPLDLDMKWGVFCNQLARGGWVLQDKAGSDYLLRPAPPVESDQDFVNGLKAMLDQLKAGA